MGGACNCCSAAKNAKPVKLGTENKWKYTLYTTLVFVIVANPLSYIFLNRLLKSFVKIANNGCPTTLGFIIITIAFTLIIRLLMDLDL